ncbi:MAG TPA: M55 family metallopeptidase [Phycisphaerae bacterium]|nr:M55 family metallopeptidase [Phycisphaerae bacterium]
MNVFVMVDMEGISGICRSDQVLSDQPEYQRARRFMTLDANACVDGLLAGGARRVVVRDAHGGGFNFLWEELDARAEYVQGRSALERMPDIARFDGLVLLGYHAMAGTPQAILEHTMSSKAWQNFWMNGRKCGEFAIDAAIAGDHGVPTVMTSGDDKLCREAKRLVKGIVAVQVKRGLDCQGGQLLSMDDAHHRIREGAKEAVAQCKRLKPYAVKHPVTMRLELVSRGNVPAGRAGVKVLDGRTYQVTAETVEQALRAL